MTPASVPRPSAPPPAPASGPRPLRAELVPAWPPGGRAAAGPGDEGAEARRAAKAAGAAPAAKPQRGARGRGAALGLINVAAFAAVVVALHWAQSFAVPLLLAVLLASLAAPVVAWLVSRGVPRAAAAALALVCLLVAVGAFGALFALSAQELRLQLPVYAERVPALLEGASAALNRQGFSTTPEQLTTLLGGAGALTLVRSTLFTTADLVSQGVIVLLLVFFSLCEIADFGGKLRRLVPDADGGFLRVEHAVRQVQTYLLLKAATSALAALGAATVLVALRVDFALPLSLFMFLAHFVPNVGVIVATVPAVAVALLGRGLGPAALVTAGYVAILFAIGNVLEPRLFGKRLGLSPLAVLVAMFFWGWLWGPLGALLSVPITMVVKVVCERVESLRWVAVLLDPGEPLWPAARPGPKGKARVLLPMAGHASQPIGLGSQTRHDRG
ncbi:MAG TPA: AI-2E family transporter [Polyangiaceae bacterium]|nr:AI-2E family transporter [Polyangiaceae bacterium]